MSKALTNLKNPELIENESDVKALIVSEVKEIIADAVKESEIRVENDFEANLNTDICLEGDALSRGHIQTTTESYAGSAQFQGAPIIEVITEETIVVQHEDEAATKQVYEGKVIEKHDLGVEIQTHIAQPILKQIHTNVIHEHHKNVLVEHTKDIVHEHHQQVIHEHHQPVIIEKHIHDHIQPIIHEKHVTLVEETHVPIVHEAQTHQTNTEEKVAVVHEILEKAIVEEMTEAPTIVEKIEKTIVINEGETKLDAVVELL